MYKNYQEYAKKSNLKIMLTKEEEEEDEEK
jgi:hypothetical protein